jgi:hypothetical protein
VQCKRLHVHDLAFPLPGLNPGNLVGHPVAVLIRAGMAPRPLRFRVPVRRDVPKANQYQGEPEAGDRYDVFSATKGLASVAEGLIAYDRDTRCTKM